MVTTAWRSKRKFPYDKVGATARKPLNGEGAIGCGRIQQLLADEDVNFFRHLSTIHR